MAATTTTRSGPVVAVLDRPKEATHSHKIWTEPPGLDTPHLTGSGSSGKSQFLFHVDADKAVLDAAAYANANKLWVGTRPRSPSKMDLSASSAGTVS